MPPSRLRPRSRAGIPAPEGGRPRACCTWCYSSRRFRRIPATSIRLCANTGARLHLIKPLGFRLDDKSLKRSGLDYHDLTLVTVHADLEACMPRSRLRAWWRWRLPPRRCYADFRFRADRCALVRAGDSRLAGGGAGADRHREFGLSFRCAPAAAASICRTRWRWSPTKRGVNSASAPELRRVNPSPSEPLGP